MNRILSTLALAAAISLGGSAAHAQSPIEVDRIEAPVLREAAIPTLERRAPAPVGNWRTSYGKLTVERRDDGKFRGSYGNAMIVGTYEDGVMSGRFYYPDGTSPNCGAIKQGTQTWGRFQFSYSEDGDAFNGTWNWCDSNLTENWTGTRD